MWKVLPVSKGRKGRCLKTFRSHFVTVLGVPDRLRLGKLHSQAAAVCHTHSEVSVVAGSGP